ncbi:toxin Cry1Ac domain D-VI-related protein, partial [Gottfriedia sp. NPDC057991]|uniref:toxin Cry1Ac domain D-VI-related protein n=1 Tax=Gottfriedia sp. NPDC057991 TaxID=3346298 RepID=UPI0036DC1123
MKFSNKMKKPINVIASSAIAFTALISPISTVLPGIKANLVEASTIDASVNVKLGMAYVSKLTVNSVVTKSSAQDSYLFKNYKQTFGTTETVKVEGNGYIVPVQTGKYKFEVSMKNAINNYDSNYYKHDNNNVYVQSLSGSQLGTATAKPKYLGGTLDVSKEVEVTLQKGTVYKIYNLFIKGDATTNIDTIEADVKVTPPGFDTGYSIGTGSEGSVGDVTISGNDLLTELTNGKMLVFQNSTTASNFSNAFKAQETINNSKVADAKAKVDALFTDKKYDTLNESTNAAAIEAAEELINALPAGSDKTNLQNLINKAKDLLDEKTKAEQADTKAKVDALFTDNKHDTLNASTDSASIEIAQNAVNKLPEGDEKSNLQNLVNKAKDLLDERTKAEQALSDAKAKVEDLFTDNTFIVINESTNQTAIDNAKAAVAKLPAGAEKTRLENLINDAKDLFDAKTKAAQELSDAKAKTEGLFTDDKFNALNGETNQATIDDAKAAVDKLPAG